jgi:predicted DNA-binding transcriptional regulator AlpA
MEEAPPPTPKTACYTKTKISSGTLFGKKRKHYFQIWNSRFETWPKSHRITMRFSQKNIRNWIQVRKSSQQ